MSASPAAPASPPWAARLPLLAATLLGTLAFLRGWVGDDAFITFRVVEMLWAGHGPVFNAGERVQAYTHPLWFFILAAVIRTDIEPYYVAIFGGVVCAAGTGYLVARTLPPLKALVAVTLLATSTSFLDFSTSGLENSLTHLLLAAMLWAAFAGEESRPWWVAAAAGLVVLNRLDLVLLVGPAVGLVLMRRPLAVLAFLPLVAWLLFAAWYYGTPLPNTMYAKVGAYGTGEAVRHGLAYLVDYCLSEPFHVAIAAAGVALGARTAGRRPWPPRADRRWLVVACCAGIGLYLLYVVVIGGDFMRGRMFTAPLLMAVVAGGVALSLDGPALSPLAAAVAASLCILALPVANTMQFDARIGDSGIVNERAFYQGAWLGHRRGQTDPSPDFDQPDSTGIALRAYAEAYGPVTLAAAGGLGQLGYYSGPRVTVIDRLGLSDAFVAREVPLSHQRPGHIYRAVAEDYFRSRADIALQPDWRARVRRLDPTLRADAVEDARDGAWADDAARRRYEGVSTLVSGPLSPGARLRTVFKYLLPLVPRPDPSEVLAREGEIAVRANYRPTFGQFRTLIAPDAGGGDGAEWLDPTAAVGMNDIDSRVTVDLGASHALSEVALQADADDTYVVRFSTDGKRFDRLWVAAPVSGGGGLQTRRTPAGFSVTARYLRIEPAAGDGRFSLGRLEAVTEAGRTVRVPGAPAWPAQPAVAGDGQATINWKAPVDGGARITKYTVRSVPAGVEVEVPAPVTSVVVNGLRNGTEYRFTVTATNTAGEGPPSPPSPAATPVERVVATRGEVKVRASFTPRSGKFSALLVSPMPPDGTLFLDANLAVAWNNPASTVVVDLAQVVTISRLTFQADNNDAYVVEFSVDGLTFGEPQSFAPTGSPGLRTRETPPGFQREARYLRIGAGPGAGDTTFALGAVEAYTASGPVIRR